MFMSAADLAFIRSEQLKALGSTATIYRRTLTDDGNGGKETTYPTSSTSACRLVFFGGRPVMPDTASASKIDPKERFILTLPYDADILETDRVAVEGSTYEVISSKAARTWETVKRFLVKRV